MRQQHIQWCILGCAAEHFKSFEGRRARDRWVKRMTSIYGDKFDWIGRWEAGR